MLLLLGLWFWKHVPPSFWSPNKAHFHIAMIRDPLAWIVSMRKRSYGIRCESASLLAPCMLHPDHSWGKLSTALGIKFPSIMAIWNYYYSSYDETVRLVRYEDAVLRYRIVMEKLASDIQSFFPVPIPHETIGEPTVKERAKEHGFPKTHWQASAYNRAESWLSKYSQRDLQIACAGLSASLMKKFDYTTCDVFLNSESSARSKLLQKLKPINTTNSEYHRRTSLQLHAQLTAVGRRTSDFRVGMRPSESISLNKYCSANQHRQISSMPHRNQHIFVDRYSNENGNLSNSSRCANEHANSSGVFFFLHYFQCKCSRPIYDISSA